MTTTVPSTDIVVSVEPLFTQDERTALAGFLAGYSGLTRDAYALDLRMFTAWCQQHGLHLFQARRADVECFGRDMESRGRARATIALARTSQPMPPPNVRPATPAWSTPRTGRRACR
jgi:integrase/recombinase XerD